MRLVKRLVMFTMLTAVFVLGIAAPSAQSSRQAEAQLKAAQQLEEAAGDLAAAIEAYRKLSTNSDRAIAAQALLKLAGCQEKLGQAEAQKTYQQVIAQYPDQTETAAEARRRLQSPEQATGSLNRQRLLLTLDPADWITGRMSVDGRYIAYGHTTDSLNYELRIHDLVNGSDRTVAAGRPGEVGFTVLNSAFSRDGQQLAYRASLTLRGQARFQLRVINLRDSGVPVPRVLVDAVPPILPTGALTVVGAIPLDWTPDSKWIAVQNRKAGQINEFAVASTVDGSMRVLKSFQSRRQGGQGYLSPDGTLLAAEVPEEGSPTDNDIVVLPLDGGPEIRAVRFNGQDRLMGWTPDGRDIVFASARSGSKALWRQRIEHGATVGVAEYIPGVSVSADSSLGLSPMGALFSRVGKTEAALYVMQAGFDFETGSFTSAPAEAASTFVRSNSNPRWSPDGKLLAYHSNRGQSAAPVLVVYTAETGETREVRPDFRFVNTHTWTWLPDNQSIVALGQPWADGNNRHDVYRIDMLTGQCTLITTANSSGRPEISRDGKTLYYNRQGITPGPLGRPLDRATAARDLATGQEREVGPVGQTRPRSSPDGTKTYSDREIPNGFAITERDEAGTVRDLIRAIPAGRAWNWHLTADFQSILVPTTDAGNGDGLIVLYSIVDGSQRQLLRAPRGQSLGIWLAAPDDRSIIVRQGTEHIYWWVPLDGRQPKALDELRGLNANLELHPNGRRLALDVREGQGSGEQVWVLENFLPSVRR